MVKSKKEASFIENIKRFIKEVKYGQIIIYIQDSQVTQIELSKKLKVNKKIEDDKN